MTLDPPPCVALRVRDSAGPWQLALIALHCRSPPKGLQEVAYTPKAVSDRLGKGLTALLPMVVGCIPVKVSTDKHTH